MKTVTMNGFTYAAPFADDPLTPAERATLTRSIARRGVLDTVHTYDSPAHGPAILDGVNRAEVAAEVGKPVPVKHLGRMTDDEARELAEEKQLGRRNLAADAYARRVKRIERVVEKRTEGKSLRTIADEEGVSLGQVQRDLEAGVSPDTPEPETVSGRDGKTYPARQPANPDADDPPEDEPEPTPAPESERPDPRNRPPKWFKPGNNADPDHRYAELMQKVSTLAAAVSKAINESFDEEGQQSKLYRYLFDKGMVHARNAYANGRHKGHVFVWLRGLRRLIKLAGLPGKHKTKDQLQSAYDAAMLDEDES